MTFEIRDPGLARNLALNYVLGPLRFNDELHFVLNRELLTIRDPNFTKLRCQVSNHSHRQLLPLTSIFQDQRTRILPVGLRSDQLVIDLWPNGRIEHRYSHGVPRDLVHRLIQELAVIIREHPHLDCMRDRRSADELQPGRASRVGDRVLVELVRSFQIPDEKVTISEIDLEVVPTSLDPVCPWDRASGNCEPGPFPLPFNFCLPDHPIERILCELQGGRTDMKSIVEPQWRKDKHQHPPSKERSGWRTWVKEVLMVDLNGRHQRYGHWSRFLQLFAPIEAHLVSNGCDSRILQIWALKSQSPTDPGYRSPESWDHSRPALLMFEVKTLPYQNSACHWIEWDEPLGGPLLELLPSSHVDPDRAVSTSLEDHLLHHRLIHWRHALEPALVVDLGESTSSFRNQLEPAPPLGPLGFFSHLQRSRLRSGPRGSWPLRWQHGHRFW